MLSNNKLPCCQQQRIQKCAKKTDSYKFFNLLTSPELLETVEELLPEHRSCGKAKAKTICLIDETQRRSQGADQEERSPKESKISLCNKMIFILSKCHSGQTRTKFKFCFNSSLTPESRLNMVARLANRSVQKNLYSFHKRNYFQTVKMLVKSSVQVRAFE